MSLSVVIPLTPEQEQQVMQLLGLGMQAGVAAPAAPPRAAAPAMPPMPAGAPAPQAPPPMPAAAPAAPANAKLENVLKLMDAYSRAGHQVAGARKVLAMLGLSRAQDANEEQLDWLASAFANTGWAP